MTRGAGAAAVVTFLVATAAAVPVSPALAEAGETGCDAGVVVVVDANELGGEPQTVCAADPATASALFPDAGFPLEYQPQLQDFVCRVDGLPTDRPCTDGDSYWSLWWAEPGGDWVYSTLGVGSLEVPAGGSVGFAWHEGEGDATPPDVEVTEPGAIDAAPAPDAEPETTDDDSDFPLWLAGLLAAGVLGAAGVVALARRRVR
ncbi:hypothetical protein [Nocardioides bizhenqiangii]|uniref:Gram-positive cocci surface proteins LPxTG domain-containing protein n=1 Tax=Nocardioides bizhenqiangii TaxID=3095076 RepID=A0ABZ0ZUD5_9ACTN|nr:hypothetical protein [Nocardioides sp. HM61]WQQ27928.1 hypothetical protein SHK19_06750 [Nocardioides sp. HM61]